MVMSGGPDPFRWLVYLLARLFGFYVVYRVLKSIFKGRKKVEE